MRKSAQKPSCRWPKEGRNTYREQCTGYGEQPSASTDSSNRLTDSHYDMSHAADRPYMRISICGDVDSSSTLYEFLCIPAGAIGLAALRLLRMRLQQQH